MQMTLATPFAQPCKKLHVYTPKVCSSVLIRWRLKNIYPTFLYLDKKNSILIFFFLKKSIIENSKNGYCSLVAWLLSKYYNTKSEKSRGIESGHMSIHIYWCSKVDITRNYSKWHYFLPYKYPKCLFFAKLHCSSFHFIFFKPMRGN